MKCTWKYAAFKKTIETAPLGLNARIMKGGIVNCLQDVVQLGQAKVSNGINTFLNI